MKHPLMVIGDLHFHNYKAHSTLIEGINSRLLDIVACWEQALDIARDNGCKAILVTGDVFHVRGSIKPSVLNKVAWCMRQATEQGFDVLIVAGNHDMENFKEGDTAVDTLAVISSGDKRVFVVSDKPQMRTFAGYSVGCIPYIHEPLEFLKAYDTMIVYKPDIMLIHQGIDDFMPDVPRTQVTAERLSSNYKGWVFAGHYHGFGIQGKVVNVGAPLMQTFGDTEQKGCVVFKDENITFEPLQAPKFVTVSDKEFHDIEGNFVRILSPTIKKAEELKAKAIEIGALSVVTVVEKAFTTAHATAITLASPTKMLADYIDLNEKYQPHKERLLSLFEKVCL